MTMTYPGRVGERINWDAEAAARASAAGGIPRFVVGRFVDRPHGVDQRHELEPGEQVSGEHLVQQRGELLDRGASGSLVSSGLTGRSGASG